MIRKASHDDWPAISDISRRSGYEDYINRVGISYIDEGDVLVYEEDRIKGFAKIEYLPDNSVWFSGLRVDPNYWRSGIGQKLTEGSLGTAADRKCTAARLLVYEDNAKSLSLVEKMGFHLVEKYNFIYGIPDTEGFSINKSIIRHGFINLGWKFADASKMTPIKGSYYSLDGWNILETNERTFEILSEGEQGITFKGDGFTCAKASLDLTNCIANYNSLEVSSGLVLEKELS